MNNARMRILLLLYQSHYPPQIMGLYTFGKTIYYMVRSEWVTRSTRPIAFVALLLAWLPGKPKNNHYKAKRGKKKHKKIKCAKARTTMKWQNNPRCLEIAIARFAKRIYRSRGYFHGSQSEQYQGYFRPNSCKWAPRLSIGTPHLSRSRLQLVG